MSSDPTTRRGSRTVAVHLLPNLIPANGLQGGIAVVVDVLRATTVMAHALTSGCTRILPCLEIDEARRLAEEHGPALLAGERLGLPIDGFDLGNSPADFTPERCRGRTLVMTTTNGTRALLAARDAGAARILVAAFANLGAVLRSLTDDPRPVHVVCAGTDGQVSLEDSALAGAIVAGLRESGEIDVNDAGLMTEGYYSARVRPDLAAELSRGRGGRRVREIGLGADLAAAFAVDSLDVRAEAILDAEPFRIVAA